MPIRLLALDLDGTLLNSRGEVSVGNLHAIREARALGVNVAIATGRRFRDAQPLALELGLDVPVISHNGALTKHARTLETVSALLLPVEAALSVIEIGRRHGADALLSDDPNGHGLLLYDHISPENHGLAKYIAWSKRIVGDQAVETVRHVPSLSEYIRHEPIHISFSGRCDEMASLADSLRDELGGRVQVLCTIYRRQDFTLVDVLNAAASKGAGVAAVAAEMGITSDEVMAMGDNHNDLEMLEYAGTPVVMSNAESDLRDRVDFELTSSNDEDGVALAIERFILGISAGGL